MSKVQEPKKERNPDGTFKKGIKYSPSTMFRAGVSPSREVVEKRATTNTGKHRTPQQRADISGQKSKLWKGGIARFKCMDCNTILANRYAKRCWDCKVKHSVGKFSTRWAGGKPNCLNCGKGLTYGAKKCNKCAAHRAEQNWRWVEDRTKLQRYNDDTKDRRSGAYGNWRKQVWLRDNFKCKIGNQDCFGRIEAHHILGYKEHPELRYEINNGITLCHAHHPRKRAEEKRLIPTFQELVSVSSNIF